MGLGVWVSGFGALGVWGSGLRSLDRVQNFRFKVQSSVLGNARFRIWHSVFGG